MTTISSVREVLQMGSRNRIESFLVGGQAHRLWPLHAMLIVLLGLFFTGCGTTVQPMSVTPPSLALSANPDVLLPGQTATITVKATNVPSSDIFLNLSCSAAYCGSISGGTYTAPALTGNPLSVTVSASTKNNKTAPDSIQLTISPPPVITSISPSIVTAGTTAELTITGTGFLPNATIAATSFDGGSLTLSQVKVLSPTSLSLTAAFPPAGAGAAGIKVSNPSPASSSAFADVYVEPAVQQSAVKSLIFSVASYHASGSASTYQCSGSAGSDILTCNSSSMDFTPGEGIRIVDAGMPERNPAPTNSPIVTPIAGRRNSNTTGTHSDCYVVYATDAYGGISTPSPRTCVSDQPTLAFSGTYNQLSPPYSLPFTSFLWYVSEDGGPYELFNVDRGNNAAQDMGERIGSYGGWPASYSAGSSGITKNGDFFTIVTAVNGNQIVLQEPLDTSVTDTEADHDDTSAIQAAINAAEQAGGGIVQIGSGHFNVRRPTFFYWPSHQSPYTTPTLDYRLKPSFAGGALLYIADGSTGHITIDGAGTSTVLQTPPGGDGGLLTVGNYSSPAYSPFIAMSMEPLDKGSTSVTLVNTSDADALHPGDDVWLYTGSFGGTCPDTNGTAGGNCHFSELNTILSVSGNTVTLKYPASKPYHDDGASSFGLVKLPVTPHDIALKDMTIDTNSIVIGGGYVYGLLVDHVTVNGSPSAGAFWAGFKRDEIIENSSWGIGEGDATWNGTEEFDQFTGIALINDQITGNNTPGSEGPSMGARLYFTEGTSQVLIMNCTFNRASVYFQDTTDDVIDHNTFNDADITVGDNYNEYKHPYFWGSYQDASILSFNSQNWAQIDNNTFNASPGFFPPWIINIGHFKHGEIDGNTINDNSPQQFLAAINSDGGEIEGNTVNLGPKATLSVGIVAIPDEGPNLPTSGFDIEKNKIVGPQDINSIQVIDSGFTNTAPVCIQNNTIEVTKGNPVNVSPTSTNLTCSGSEP
jgi:hypothetical protein